MKLLEAYIVLNNIKIRSAVLHSVGPPHPRLSQGCHPFDDSIILAHLLQPNYFKKLNNRVRKDPGIKSKLCLFIRWANSSITYCVPKSLLIAHRQLYLSPFSSCTPFSLLLLASLVLLAPSYLLEFFWKESLKKAEIVIKKKSFTNIQSSVNRRKSSCKGSSCARAS